MGKTIKEDCKTISMHKLNEWGVFKCGYYGGSIIWTSGYDGKKSDVSYVLNLDEGYFRLHYNIRTWGEDGWTSIDHKYPLTSTDCNYGGARWWFICSVYRSGVYCGRRVETLYLGSGSHYFACRHCYDLSYQSRNDNRRGRFSFFGKIMDAESRIEELEKKLTTKFYNGKPTRKYRRILKLAGHINGIDIETMYADMEKSIIK